MAMCLKNETEGNTNSEYDSINTIQRWRKLYNTKNNTRTQSKKQAEIIRILKEELKVFNEKVIWKFSRAKIKLIGPYLKQWYLYKCNQGTA